MKTSPFFRKNIPSKKIRSAAKKEQNLIRLRMKKQKEGLIFLDFLISSQFVRDEAEGQMSFLPWESPDFLVQMRKRKIGVELTRAVRLQEARPGPSGADENASPLQQWNEAVMQRIAKKVRKYDKGTIRLFNRNVLIVVDEVPLDIEEGTAPELVEALTSALAERNPSVPNFVICVKVRRRCWWRIAKEKNGAWRGLPYQKERA